MRLFRNMSVQRKQMLVIMVTTGVAMLLICAGLAVFQVITFRREMVEHLTTYGNVVANNISAALDFDDSKAVDEALAGLKAEPNIIDAKVYSQDGSVFAEYHRAGAVVDFAAPQKMQSAGYIFNKGILSVFQPIKSGNEVIGAIYIRSDTNELADQLKQYFAIITGALGITLCISLLLSNRLQRWVSKPLLHLATVAQTVAQKKDYTLRATKAGEDEVGQLIDRFNEMLEQMQGREEKLERRVEERTEAMRKEVADRKRAEEALLESKALYSSLVEQLPVGIFRKDTEGRYVLLNSWFCNLHGKPPQHLLSKTPMEVSKSNIETEEGRQNLRQGASHHEQIMASGKRIEIEEQHVGPDGEMKYLQVIKTPVYNAEGKIVGSQGILMDITARKKAEEALLESKALYSSLVEQLPVGIFRKDKEGKYVLVNSQFCFLHGKKTEDFLNHSPAEVSWTKIKSEEVRDHLLKGTGHHEQIMKNGAKIEVEEDHVSPDGETRHLHVIKTPVYNAENKIIGSQGILMDVTDRKHAVEALQESQALYHSLVEQLPAIIFRKNAEGRFILVNSHFCNLHRLKREQILGKLPREIGLEQIARGGADHLEIMRTGKAIETEQAFPDADGQICHFSVIKSPVFGLDGKVIGSQGILMDITARKAAEAELNRERNLLRSLMDNSDDCIYFKDNESRFIRCSSQMAKIFGVKNVEELIGKRDSDFYSGEHADDALADEKKIIRTGEALIGKIEKETWPDGHVTWALTSKMPLRNENGEIIGTFGISKNITALKEAEAKVNAFHKQLLDTSRQAGMAEVATSVLHNVGNVLNSVNVSSSLISDKVRNSKVANIAKVVSLMRQHEADLGNFFANDPKGKQLPGYLESLATHLAQEQKEILSEVGALVSNVVHIKEIVSMQQNYAKSSGIVEQLKVSDLVDDALRMNEGAMNRHHVNVVREYADVPPILTEKHKVLQILVNLIRNAKYACDDSGREDKQITLRVANGEGRIKISVIDNGVGIVQENLTRIFNHGFTTRKEGHGFGLHSGANAAKELGGSLRATSDGHNRGATFTLELPVNRQPKSL